MMMVLLAVGVIALIYSYISKYGDTPKDSSKEDSYSNGELTEKDIKKLIFMHRASREIDKLMFLDGVNKKKEKK